MTKPIILSELAAADPEVRFSPHCWEIRYALAHKQIECERVPWRFTDKEAISFSGRGRVSVLVHGGNVLTDSWRIANFLEAEYPSRPPLFGSDAQPLATFVNAWADTAPALLPQIAPIVLVDIHNNVADADTPYFRQTRERWFGATLEKVSSNRPELVRTLGTTFAPLRAILLSSPYLGGEKPRYADYSVFGMFMWARCISDIELLQPDDPIHQWRDRLLDLFEGLGRRVPTVASSRFKSDATSC